MSYLTQKSDLSTRTKRMRESDYIIVDVDFWVVMRRGLMGRYHRYGGTHCLHLQSVYVFRMIAIIIKTRSFP